MTIKKLKFIPIVCTIFMISMLAIGCSNTSNNDKETPEESKTRTVKTVKGEIEVPANPKRIAVNFYQGDLLALGVKPIATDKAEGETAFKEELDGVAEVEKWDPEEVMALDPDLLIVTSDEQYEKLHKIAPTILMDKTFTLLESHSGKTWIYGNKWGRGGEVFYDYLDLKAPDVIEKEIIDADQYREISLEALPEYCGDYVINPAWDGPDTLTDNDLWNNIAAVKEGRVIKTSAELYFYVDIYSMNVQLDKFVDDILATTNK